MKKRVLWGIALVALSVPSESMTIADVDLVAQARKPFIDNYGIHTDLRTASDKVFSQERTQATGLPVNDQVVVDRFAKDGVQQAWNANKTKGLHQRAFDAVKRVWSAAKNKLGLGSTGDIQALNAALDTAAQQTAEVKTESKDWGLSTDDVKEYANEQLKTHRQVIKTLHTYAPSGSALQALTSRSGEVMSGAKVAQNVNDFITTHAPTMSADAQEQLHTAVLTALQHHPALNSHEARIRSTAAYRKVVGASVSANPVQAGTELKDL